MTLKLAADAGAHPTEGNVGAPNPAAAADARIGKMPFSDEIGQLPDAPIAASAEPEDDGRIPVTVRLTPFHHEYLAARAARNGNTPERELEGILRTYRAHHDMQRHGLNTAPTGPGMGAGTRRA